MDFDNLLKEKTEEINGIVLSFMPKEDGKLKTITDSINYSIDAPGKRIRPLLMYETYKLLGGRDEIIKPFMAAIEMIHTYSLIHDDLPAMDNDDYRRGRKTNHIVFGEDIAILAGDALLNLAFETVLKASLTADNKDLCIKAMNILATKAGIYGMIGGQTIDVKSEGQKIDIDTVLTIHNLKTAALIEASMMVGAVLAGADDDAVGRIEQAAKCVGLAFQIQDDILDVTGDEKSLGKPVLSDEKNEKYTYVTLKGLETAKEDVKIYSDKAMSVIDGFEGDTEFLKALFKKLIDRKK